METITPTKTKSTTKTKLLIATALLLTAGALAFAIISSLKFQSEEDGQAPSAEAEVVEYNLFSVLTSLIFSK